MVLCLSGNSICILESLTAAIYRVEVVQEEFTYVVPFKSDSFNVVVTYFSVCVFARISSETRCLFVDARNDLKKACREE